MAQDNRYKVYRLTNHSLGETYIGVSRDIALRCSQHAGDCSGGAKSISHWNWNKDDIKVYTYPERFNYISYASEYAHDIERFCRLQEGYSVFLTRGV
jgi:hypothetical protein